MSEEITSENVTLFDLQLERYMGVGVIVRLSPDDSELGFKVSVEGFGGPTTPQAIRDVLQLTIETLDETEGTSYDGSEEEDEDAKSSDPETEDVDR